MTPAARAAAAIALLDRWLTGEPAEAALTRWARASRFAGSGDREAVRDLVYDAIRKRRSAAALGGALEDGKSAAAPPGGRTLILGCLRAAAGLPPEWDGARHAPAPLSADERTRFTAPLPNLPRAVELDCPDWLLPLFERALGADADVVLDLMRQRAPVFLRANAARIDTAALTKRLAEEGIAAQPHPLAPMALQVISGARRLRASAALAEGLCDLQDAASQAVAERFAAALKPGAWVLDYCAGGGGKALALAARGLRVAAHDADPRRMRDLPLRAARAGVDIPLVSDPGRGAPWPAILADVPCSGAGSWRRAPEAKWTLTRDALDRLIGLQDTILNRAAGFLAPRGVLGYATCSLLCEENEDRIKAFLSLKTDWVCLGQWRLSPLEGGDGFFLTLLQKP